MKTIQEELILDIIREVSLSNEYTSSYGDGFEKAISMVREKLRENGFSGSVAELESNKKNYERTNTPSSQR